MKDKVIYRCSQCRNESLKWMGRYSECDSWNSFEEIILGLRIGLIENKAKEKRG